MFRQTVAAFLYISESYDNVLIDVLYARKGAASGNCPLYVEPTVV
jgi:hypothetical protein